MSTRYPATRSGFISFATRERRERGSDAAPFGALVWTAFVFMIEFFVASGSKSPFRELLMIIIAAGLAIVLVPDEFGSEA